MLLTIIPSFDFDLFFTDSEANVSYISVPPNMFGNVLSAAIKAYFESNVYERFEDEYGLALYSKLNHEIASLNCFKIEIFRELNNKINNPSKLNDLANYLSLASHHVPESKLLAATVFCSVIPKLVAAPFLQAIETYLPSKREKLMSANVKDMYYAYRQYRVEPLESPEKPVVDLASRGKRENHKKTCCPKCRRKGHPE